METAKNLISNMLGEGGHSIQVVTTKKNDHSFEVMNESEFLKILTKADVIDRSVVIVSVAGAFRTGKSFLLNLFLRYLRTKYDSEKLDDSDVEGDAELKGFSWVGGPKRNTTGIHVWSEVFKAELPDGERVAILLMDTQGMFDSKTTLKECVGIFAMSTMLSSVQIYNLSKNIQEDHLQHLQLFVNYGRMALKEDSHKPFQDLWFLVRDFEGEEHGFPLGIVGGDRLLDEAFSISSEVSNDKSMATLRSDIRDCFSRVSCFLLPHPGDTVRKAKYNGNLKLLNLDFKHHVQVLMEQLLSPSRLVTKKVNGKPLKAYQVTDLLKRYSKIFNGNDLPTPKSVFEATAEANNHAAIKASKNYYMTEMKKFLENELLSAKRWLRMLGQLVTLTTKQTLSDSSVESHHERVKAEAVKMFDDAPKMGGREFAEPYRRLLDEEIEKIYQELNHCNEGKSYGERFLQMAALLSTLCQSVWSFDPPSLLKFLPLPGTKP